MNLSKNLGQHASAETQTGPKASIPRISQDPETGESFLKIPIPETGTIQKILSALTGVLMNFQANSPSETDQGLN